VYGSCGYSWRFYDEGPQTTMGDHNRHFLVISAAISSKPLKLKPILLCSVMKCCLRRQFDYMFLSRFRKQLPNVKTNENTTILSTTKMFASRPTLVSGDIMLMPIFARANLTVGWSKSANFNAFSRHIFRTFTN